MLAQAKLSMLFLETYKTSTFYDGYYHGSEAHNTTKRKKGKAPKEWVVVLIVLSCDLLHSHANW